MLLKDLKEQMLLPEEEYIINRYVNIGDIDVLLLSLTVERDKNSIWMIYEDEGLSGEDLYYRDSPKTNRERLLRSIDNTNKYKSFSINKMELGGHTIKFGSSRSSHIYDMNREGLMQLQHFAEKNLIPEKWDDIRLENLVIVRYNLMEDQVLPSIDSLKELPIVLYMKNDSVEVPIQSPFKVKFGRQEIGTKITYHDPVLEKDNYFFINEIYSYDVYEDTLRKMEKVEDEEMRKEMLKNFNEDMEDICPRDKNMAVIRYETIDDIQLNFKMKDYLDAEAIKSNSASAMMVFSKMDEVGVNGYKLQECVLKPIDKEFNGELEIELFSRNIIIPGETVEVVPR